MWIEERYDISYKEGFYMFGGQDERDVLKNDLWLAQPDYEYNKEVLSVVDCDFVSDRPTLGMTLKKIDNYSGKPPCPRSQFQMTHLVTKSKE